MSASRVVSAEGMDVDEAGVALPTPEWMEAAQKAADTDGILENASAKRQKVCISCNTLTSPAHANHAQECTQKRESLRKARVLRVRVAQRCGKKMTEKEHPKGLLRLSSALPPKSLPNHCRGTAVALPWHCRGTAEHGALELAALAARGSSGTPRQNGDRTPDPGQDARDEAHWAALLGLPFQAAAAYKYLFDLGAGHGFESGKPRFWKN